MREVRKSKAQGDASVPTQPNTTPAPTRGEMVTLVVFVHFICACSREEKQDSGNYFEYAQMGLVNEDGTNRGMA